MVFLPLLVDETYVCFFHRPTGMSHDICYCGLGGMANGRAGTLAGTGDPSVNAHKTDLAMAVRPWQGLGKNYASRSLGCRFLTT